MVGEFGDWGWKTNPLGRPDFRLSRFSFSALILAHLARLIFGSVRAFLGQKLYLSDKSWICVLKTRVELWKVSPFLFARFNSCLKLRIDPWLGWIIEWSWRFQWFTIDTGAEHSHFDFIVQNWFLFRHTVLSHKGDLWEVNLGGVASLFQYSFSTGFLFFH